MEEKGVCPVLRTEGRVRSEQRRCWQVQLWFSFSNILVKANLQSVRAESSCHNHSEQRKVGRSKVCLSPQLRPDE